MRLHLAAMSFAFQLAVSLIIVTQIASLRAHPQPLAPSEYQQQMLVIEKAKLQLEHDKLQEERRAAKYSFLTIALPLLAALGTIWYGIRNANLQAAVQAQLKAVEVVISAPGPWSAKERFEIVRNLLGERFVKPLDERVTFSGVGLGHDQSRKELIEMLLQYPDRRGEVLQFWDITFGWRNLSKDIETLGKVLKVSTPVSTAHLTEEEAKKQLKRPINTPSGSSTG